MEGEKNLELKHKYIIECFNKMYTRQIAILQMKNPPTKNGSELENVKEFLQKTSQSAEQIFQCFKWLMKSLKKLFPSELFDFFSLEEVMYSEHGQIFEDAFIVNFLNVIIYLMDVLKQLKGQFQQHRKQYLQQLNNFYLLVNDGLQSSENVLFHSYMKKTLICSLI